MWGFRWNGAGRKMTKVCRRGMDGLNKKKKGKQTKATKSHNSPKVLV